MSCVTEQEVAAERAYESQRPACKDCGDYPAPDDWETLEGIHLCAECADDRIEQRGTAPTEWFY